MGITLRHADQPKLLDLGHQLPSGLVYKPDFLTQDEEDILVAYIQNLELKSMLYMPRHIENKSSKGEYESKRRSIGFGAQWDDQRQKIVLSEPLPRFLHGAQRKIGKWLGIPTGHVAEALINEYTPGSAIGWHVDNEGFDKIVGVSLAGWANMRFRPLRRVHERNARDVVSLELEPRSAYIMQSEVRWKWQHSVSPVRTLRYSITFRTLPA